MNPLSQPYLPLRFRPTSSYWRRRIGEAVVLMAAGAAFAVAFYALDIQLTTVGKLFFAVVLCIILVQSLNFLWTKVNTHLQFTESNVSGRTGRWTFDFLWSEVVVIQYQEAENNQQSDLLLLATQDRMVRFDMTGFDKTAVWQALQTYAPQDTLQPEAYKNLTFYQLQEQGLREKWSTLTSPVSVHLPLFFRLLFGSSFILSMFGIFMTRDGVRLLLIFPALLFGYSFLASLITLSLDKDTITVKKLWATHQIPFSEIYLVEISPDYSTVVFYGDQKRLACLGAQYWHGRQKDDFILLLNRQLDERQIEVKTSWKAAFRSSKNTRI